MGYSERNAGNCAKENEEEKMNKINIRHTASGDTTTFIFTLKDADKDELLEILRVYFEIELLSTEIKSKNGMTVITLSSSNQLAIEEFKKLLKEVLMENVN